MGWMDDELDGKKPTKAEEKTFKRKTHIAAGHLFGLIGGLSFIDERARFDMAPTMEQIKEDFGYEAAAMINGCEQLFGEGMRLTYKTSNAQGEFVYGLTFRGRLLVEVMKSIWVVLEHEADERYKKEQASKKAKKTRKVRGEKARRLKGVKASKK